MKFFKTFGKPTYGIFLILVTEVTEALILGLIRFEKSWFFCFVFGLMLSWLLMGEQYVFCFKFVALFIRLTPSIRKLYCNIKNEKEMLITFWSKKMIEEQNLRKIFSSTVNNGVQWLIKWKILWLSLSADQCYVLLFLKKNKMFNILPCKLSPW